jgi:acyl carrier protein
MTKDDFLRELEKSLEQPSGSISATSTLADIQWDSLAEIGFVAFADRKLGVALAPDRLRACQDVSDLIGLLGSKVVD